jgi:hypothetical protein
MKKNEREDVSGSTKRVQIFQIYNTYKTLSLAGAIRWTVRGRTAREGEY